MSIYYNNKQPLQEINKILGEVAETQQKGQQNGHLYIVITKEGKIATTANKKEANSMKEVAQFIGLVVKFMGTEDLSKQKTSRNFYTEIHRSFGKIQESYLRKYSGFFGAIRRIFSSTYQPTFKTLAEVEEAFIQQKVKKPRSVTFDEQAQDPKNYGTYKRGTNLQGEEITRTKTYTQYEKEKQLRAASANQGVPISSFEKLKEAETVNAQEITWAFESDLSKALRETPAYQISSDTPASRHVLKAFNDTLDRLATEVEKNKISPEKAAEQFETEMADCIFETNQETIEVDRSLFEDIRGSLPSNDPHVLQFIQEYKDGTWMETKDEEGNVTNPRKLTYLNIPLNEMSDINKALTEIVDKESLKETLLKFFIQCKGKQ